MRMFPLFVATMFGVAGPAQPQSYDATTVGGMEWNRPFASGTCCSGLGPVRYSAQEFYVNVEGSYDLSSLQNSFDGYVLVYVDEFDPLAQTANFVAGDDDGVGGIGTSDIDGMILDANRTYIIVTTGFENGAEGTFTNTISGPGTSVFSVFGAQELERLVAAAGTAGRIIVVNARQLARSGGQNSLASRDARPSFTRVSDPESGRVIVTQSTQGAPGMIGNVYTWINVTGFNAEDDTTNREFSGHGLQVGADVALSPDMVVGLSVGIQDIAASDGVYSQSGELRFVQPYLAYSAGAWSADATLMYGLGDYTQTSVGGTGTGETRLVALTFDGGYEFAIDGATTLTPIIGVAYGQERVEGIGGTLAGAGTEIVRFTQASLGAEIRQTISGGEVLAGLHADWLDTSSDSALVSDLLVDDGWTGRVALGLATELGNGLSLTTSVEFSGLGGNLRQTSGALRFAFRF